MARQKKHTKDVEKTAAVLNAKASKVRKPNKNKPNIALGRSLLHINKALSPERGITSIERAPKHLAELAKLNAQASPLLRLPAEMRTAIWKATMAGSLFDMHEHHATLTEVLKRDVGNEIRGRPITSFANREDAILDHGFALSRVCRQIYFETDTLRYAHNTFLFDQHHGQRDYSLMMYWVRNLQPAHRDAVRDIAVDEGLFQWYLREWSAAVFRRTIPNLRRVQVNERGVDAVIRAVWCPGWKVEGAGGGLREGYKEVMRGEVRRREGEGVELVFRE